MNNKKIKNIYILSFIILLIVVCIIISISNNAFKVFNRNLNNESTKNSNINTNITKTSNALGGRANTDNFYINDKRVILNTTLTSKYSLGFLLNYQIDEDLPISEYEVSIDDYIAENKPKGTGIWITDSELLKGNKPSRDTLLDILKDFRLNYTINNDGFLEKNNSSVEIAKNINKIIESDKLVVIGFCSVYYAYFDNINDEVGFEPIGNIYPYIIKGCCDADELQEIVKQILVDIGQI